MKKKILLINKSLSVGGIETVLLTQYRTLKMSGHDVDILLFKDIVDFPVQNIQDIYYLDNYSSIKSFVNMREKTSSYQLIICHAQSERICKKVKSLHRKNILFVMHGMHSKKLLNGNIFARFLRKARMQFLYKDQNLVTVSDAVKDDIESIKINYKKIETIYNPFDIEHIKNLACQKLDIKIKKQYLVWVGRISEVKNLPFLLEVYIHLASSYDLVMIGDGSENIKSELLQTIKQHGIEDKVHFLGFLENPYPYIKNAKSLLLTSDNEGLPTVVLESLILNTPVFSRNIPAVNEILSNYYTKGICHSDNKKEIAEQILQNINKPINVHKIHKELSFKNSNNKYLNYFQ
ncbi:MAG TPA: glycosyltransferase [Arcobacter sp.]|jgi:glycosyltransferase involved in cell wall biosynthesis|nr:glycosyltransferase [Arcobacter sp.]